MNKAKKGKRFEYQVRDYFRARGYIAFMLSASKPFDLIVFSPEQDTGCAIECKTGGSIAAAVKQLEKAIVGTPLATIVAMKRKHGIEFYGYTNGEIVLLRIPNLKKGIKNGGKIRDSARQPGEDWGYDRSIEGPTESEHIRTIPEGPIPED